MSEQLRRFCVVLALGALGCAVAGPTDPVWGKQTCGHCRMLVSDPSYAGQVLTNRDERVFFDDVGCMVEYVEEHPGVARELWARENGAWVDARKARYRTGAATPMDYGFVPAEGATVDYASMRGAIVARKAEAGR